ncbi:MAG: tagaturonate reductase [Clostridia bacterium]|nr:tagaturonate reductase [Clostridia bacterium]
MEKITQNKPKRPIKVIQFGGGVFLRGFFDWMLQKANEAHVYCGNAVIVRSRTNGEDPLKGQNFNYTHLARDAKHNDISLIDSIAYSISANENYDQFLALAENPEADVIVSNTTEAGIVYEKCAFAPDTCPKSFPAKLTALLYRRFEKGLDGMLILPCELIENNGDILKDIVLRHAQEWKLGEAFYDFVKNKCSFRNTLVDRIVSGKPDSDIELGYIDEHINTSEYFHLFVIEGESDERLPFDKIGLNVRFVPSVSLYRTIKVRILNGAHTSMIPYALLCGVETVGECLENGIISEHLKQCLAEIVDSLDIERSETEEYAAKVLERFSNPYIHHRCASIALNSVSKFRVRVLPSILEYEKKYQKAPSRLLFSLSKLIEFYKNGTPNDSPDIMKKMKDATLTQILSNTELWGEDISRFEKEVEMYADTSER